MTSRLASLLNADDSKPLLILDSAAYAGHVVLQDRPVPWRDATACANHLAQVQSLLGPDLPLIHLDEMIADIAADDEALRTAMTAKRRAGFATRALLAADSLKECAHSVVAAAVHALRSPVLLHLQSPAALLRDIDESLNPGADTDFDDDAVEFAAVYYADWLRTFADLDVAGIIFDERSAGVAAEAYGPISNTAAHYDWPVGHRRDDVVEFDNLDAALTVVPDSFWDGGDSVPSSSLRFAQIPADAVPEKVLELVASLKEARQPA